MAAVPCERGVIIGYVKKRGDVKTAQYEIQESVCNNLCGSGCAAAVGTIQPHTIRLLANANLPEIDLIYPSPSGKSAHTNAKIG